MFQDESMREPISREKINDIYKQAAEHYPEGYLVFSEEQNVSSDIIGMPRAAAVIEGSENHTRTAAVLFDAERILKACACDLGEPLDIPLENKIFQIPVTQAVIYGWYDNELGSYTNMLGDRTVSIAKLMQH